MTSRIIAWACLLFLVIAGSIWILQGFDVAFAPKSFMTDDRQWVLWGSAALVGGAVLIWSWQRGRAGSD